MKITSEKKGISSRSIHTVSTKVKTKISLRAISITMDSIFQLKVSVINKIKDTHHKYQ